MRFFWSADRPEARFVAAPELGATHTFPVYLPFHFKVMGKLLLPLLPLHIHSSFSYGNYTVWCHVLCSSATLKAAKVKNHFFSEPETRSCFLSHFKKVKSRTSSKAVGFSFPIPHMSFGIQKLFVIILD